LVFLIQLEASLNQKYFPLDMVKLWGHFSQPSPSLHSKGGNLEKGGLDYKHTLEAWLRSGALGAEPVKI
jgi:hypothetical protein